GPCPDGTRIGGVVWGDRAVCCTTRQPARRHPCCHRWHEPWTWHRHRCTGADRWRVHRAGDSPSSCLAGSERGGGRVRMTSPALNAARMAAYHLESFRDHLSLEAGHSPHTIAAYRRDLVRLIEFAASKGVDSPDAITTQLLRDYVFLLKDLGLAGSTIRRNISAIRTWFGFLAAEGLVSKDPSDRLETPARWRTLPETLTVDEVTRLLESPGVDDPMAWRDRALLEL